VSALSGGFGFVELETAEDASAVIARLSGTELEGRRISIEVTKLSDAGDGARRGSGNRGGWRGAAGSNWWTCNAVSSGQEVSMNVLAFSSPASPQWRWRVVNYNRETVAESASTFTTIAAAVTAGHRHLSEMNLDDRFVAASPYRWAPYFRRR
jgi:RNA recognition motif-containing protein